MLTTTTWGEADSPRRALLLHGLTSSGAVWWRIAEGLAGQGYHVVAPDLRGHGASARAGSYRIQELAADVRELGSGWDLLVGHSLGGVVAAALQDLTARLVLIDPVFDIPDAVFETVVGELVAEVDATAEALRDAHPAWHPRDVDLKVAAARATSGAIVEQILRDNFPWHHLGLAARLAVPTVVVGADPELGATYTPDQTEGNPLVTAYVVKGAGHSVYRDDPEAVLARLTGPKQPA